MSLNIWHKDGDSGELQKVAGQVNINNDVVSENTAWSSKTTKEFVVNSLVDKVDASELAGLKRRYNSIEELNTIKKKSLVLVNGEDNTQKVLDALDVGEVLSDYFSNGGSTSRFGISSSLGTYFIITFEKNDSGYAKITAKSTTSNTVLVRYHNANELSAWQEIATMDNVVEIPSKKNVSTWDKQTYLNIFRSAKEGVSFQRLDRSGDQGRSIMINKVGAYGSMLVFGYSMDTIQLVTVWENEIRYAKEFEGTDF